MEPKTIELTIDPSGNVVVHVRGVAGASCTDITGALENALGTVTDREYTGEYFDGGDPDGIETKIYQ